MIKDEFFYLIYLTMPEDNSNSTHSQGFIIGSHNPQNICYSNDVVLMSKSGSYICIDSVVLGSSIILILHTHTQSHTYSNTYTNKYMLQTKNIQGNYLFKVLQPFLLWKTICTSIYLRNVKNLFVISLLSFP